jgi:hypothetical protein
MLLRTRFASPRAAGGIRMGLYEASTSRASGSGRRLRRVRWPVPPTRRVGRIVMRATLAAWKCLAGRSRSARCARSRSRRRPTPAARGAQARLPSTTPPSTARRDPRAAEQAACRCRPPTMGRCDARRPRRWRRTGCVGYERYGSLGRSLARRRRRMASRRGQALLRASASAGGRRRSAFLLTTSDRASRGSVSPVRASRDAAPSRRRASSSCAVARAAAVMRRLPFA